MQATANSIFGKKIEFLNLALPIVFLLLLVPEFLWFSKSLDQSYFQRLFIEIILLNVTHQIFTVAMIAFLPELREWFSHHRVRPRFWGEIFLVFVLISLVYYVSFMYIRPYWFKILLQVLTLFFPIHHALSQSFGISYLYTSSLKDPETKKLETLEKKFSFAFVFIYLSCLIPLAMYYRYLLPLPKAYVPFIKSALCGVVILSFLALWTVFWRYKKEIRIKKILFSARYLLWIFLFSSSPIASAGTRIIHGVEYGFVTHKMVGNSRAKKISIWAIVLFVVFVIFSCQREYYLYLRSMKQGGPHWLVILTSISLGLTYVHYYLDRRLFRMRHPINRNTVGKLLS